MLGSVNMELQGIDSLIPQRTWIFFSYSQSLLSCFCGVDFLNSSIIFYIYLLEFLLVQFDPLFQPL